MNLTKFLVSMAAVFALSFMMYGCEGGDQISQSASGGGSNAVGDGNFIGSDAEKADDGTISGGGGVDGQTSPEHVPAHCADYGFEPERLIGCSTESYQECRCYDPTNPEQSG